MAALNRLIRWMGVTFAVALVLGLASPRIAFAVDADTDGVDSSMDCDDNDNTVGAPELRYADADSDGYGDPGDSDLVCPGDPLYNADNNFDCDDSDPAYPDFIPVDMDMDGLGNPSDTDFGCPNQPGFADNTDDCDDSDFNIGGVEPRYPDADGDGIGEGSVTTDACPNDTAFADVGGDNCPGVANAGQEDADTDGIGDACDTCPNDPDNDADMDSVCGDVDVCPGFDDTVDSDADGTPDGCDGCPADPAKIAAGECGCGVADTDSDGDGTADCIDGCPADPAKGDPGACGCGGAETDSDGDGTPDCVDACPYNPYKVVSYGVCGCDEEVFVGELPNGNLEYECHTPVGQPGPGGISINMIVVCTPIRRPGQMPTCTNSEAVGLGPPPPAQGTPDCGTMGGCAPSMATITPVMLAGSVLLRRRRHYRRPTVQSTRRAVSN